MYTCLTVFENFLFLRIFPQFHAMDLKDNQVMTPDLLVDLEFFLEDVWGF